MRAVIYARYSSNLQRSESIEDQVEVCRRYIQSQNWTLVRMYSDAAISGASRQRPDFLGLIRDAERCEFDVVVCEAVDRLGRRLADTADLHDRLAFHGIKLHAPSFGEMTQIHVAVMGMMAQIALKDLGEKTKRGQLGRVLKGKVAGGLGYGYRVSPPATDNGRGERTVVEHEALIVGRIFREYAAGKSPEAIAKDLNRESVSGPGGRPWSNTTIRGQAARGTGLLNNEMYCGLLVWNRCSYVKDPHRGKKVARPHPRDKWEITKVPHLRIIDHDLWTEVKGRQEMIRRSATSIRSTAVKDTIGSRLNAAHRPHFLLSGLVKCGCCGGGYTVVAKDRYGCATRRQKGLCENGRTITRQDLESRVLVGLKDRLLAPELVKEFIREFYAEVKRHRASAKAQAGERHRKLADIDRKVGFMLKAIEDGMYHPSMKDKIAKLEADRAALIADANSTRTDGVDVLVHPNLPDLYRRKVSELEQLLDADPARDDAKDLIRSMIDKVVLTPREQATGLDAILYGELGTILAVCDAVTKNSDPTGVIGSQLSVVAGVGFELTTFRL